MSNIAINVENVSKVYKLYDKPIDRLKETLSLSKKTYHKDHYALDSISFEVKKGETVGIIGTNGSGKSTLLKMITGVLTPTSGNVTVNGKVSALLELGAGFNPEYTGIENIYLNGTMMGYSKEEMDKKVEPILEFADIGDFINQPVKTYSSGMFARLAFAVAINVEPEILIVDEALSVGDISFQNKCFRKFEELRKLETTILFVSHDLNSIKQMCSNVLWIEKGIQKMFSDTMNVCNQYHNEEIKRNNREHIDRVENKKLELNTITNDVFNFPKIQNNKGILSNKAEILSVFIQDEQGNITNKLDVNKEYNFNIIVRFNERIENAIVGFVIETNKGVNIISFNTYLSTKKTFDAQTNQTIKVNFECKIPKLMSGEYLISPAIADGNQKNNEIITWLHNTNKITIYNQGLNVSLLELDNQATIFNLESKEINLY